MAGNLTSLLKRIVDGSTSELGRAVALPRETYTDREYFEFERDRLLKTAWICVGHISQVAQVGDYFTIDLLGEPLVVVRGDDGIRALSRVCLHRWGLLAEGKGNARFFSCPFHRWVYDLSGRLVSAVAMDQADEFDIKECRLKDFRTEIIPELGLIFVNLSGDAEPLSPSVEGLVERLRNFRMGELVVIDESETENLYNWKFQIEIGMEAYHHFAVHRNSLEPIYPGLLSRCEEDKGRWAVCHSPLKEGSSDLLFPPFPDLTPVERKELGLDLYHIYPLTRLGVYPDRIRVQIIIPLAPDRTSSRRIYLVRPEVAANETFVEEQVAQMTAVASISNPEDQRINQMQQKSALSSAAEPGRLSHLEATVWQLAEFIRAKVRESAAL